MRPDAVDDDDLLMQQGGLELVETHAIAQQSFVQMAAGASHERAVGMRTGNHEMHGHATLYHHAEQLADTFIGGEVRILDDDFATSTGDGNCVEQGDG